MSKLYVLYLVYVFLSIITPSSSSSHPLNSLFPTAQKLTWKNMYTGITAHKYVHLVLLAEKFGDSGINYDFPKRD